MEKIYSEISKPIPRELRMVVENTNLLINENSGKITKIFGSKKDGGVRIFYISNTDDLCKFVSNLKNKEILFQRMLNFIAENKNILNPSVKMDFNNEFEFKYFNLGDIENKKIISSIELGKRIKINSDLNSMYENIYTHSISWAYYGKDDYKKWFLNNKKVLNENFDINSNHQFDTNDYEMKIFLNEFDIWFRTIIRKDHETVGILTGLNISDIISDFILSGIDMEIRNIDGYDEIFNFYHFKDDYSFIFYTNNETKSMEIFNEIISIFINYKLQLKLSINDKKITFDVENKVDTNDLKEVFQQNHEERSILYRSFDFYDGPYAINTLISDDEIMKRLEAIESSEGEALDNFLLENRVNFKNKVEYLKHFSYAEYSVNTNIRTSINDWINEIFNNPFEILRKDNFVLLKNFLISMGDNINELIKRFKLTVEEYFIRGYEMEYIAINSLFFTITGNQEFRQNVLSKNSKFNDIFSFSNNILY